jgi:anti-anti-sigma factor
MILGRLHPLSPRRSYRSEMLFSFTMALSITSRGANSIAILQLQGNVTIGPHLRSFQSRARRVLEEDGCRGLVLNFAGVSALDSAGIGELVKIHSLAAARGIRAVIAQASPRVKELLAITRVDALFAFADSELSALKGLT